MRWPSHCALDVVILTDAKTHQGGLGWGGCRQHHRLTTDSALWQHHRRPTTCLSSESPSDFISHRTTRRPPAPLPHSASLHSAEDRHHVLRSPSAHCTSSSAPSGSHRRPDLWKRDTYMSRARNRWSRPSALRRFLRAAGPRLARHPAIPIPPGRRPPAAALRQR